ncbi:hypothetical protein [Erythrobacter sp. THAF29]|uniref:hypothetical protein n=1 Tax=Erythrobacter sp. THAF29 TaxID=2587851 RepID=UPI0012696262|nr:hypothetical protein [Erythrobacter sp. THAF29]QFT77992.1 hypothetical protein FIU90_10635 [Erythrobacter sp. THAF29]
MSVLVTMVGAAIFGVALVLAVTFAAKRSATRNPDPEHNALKDKPYGGEHGSYDLDDYFGGEAGGGDGD